MYAGEWPQNKGFADWPSSVIVGAVSNGTVVANTAGTSYIVGNGWSNQQALVTGATALWSNQSLFDNLALPARLHSPEWSKAELEKAVRRAAEVVGYDDDLRARPAELSSGERKLIGLARALVLDPELLFMDDPTAELDEASAERVSDIVDALKARGRSVFVTSGVSDFASRCADRVAVLIGGRLAALGSYAEAAAWTDHSVRAVTGRLKSRSAAPKQDWEEGLAGAWATAIAEGSTTAPEDASRDDDRPDEALGDIINDVSGDEAEPDGKKEDGS